MSALPASGFSNTAPIATGRSRGLADAPYSLLTVDKLRRALELAGIEFSNGDRPGVHLKLAGGGQAEHTE